MSNHLKLVYQQATETVKVSVLQEVPSASATSFWTLATTLSAFRAFLIKKEEINFFICISLGELIGREKILSNVLILMSVCLSVFKSVSTQKKLKGELLYSSVEQVRLIHVH